MVAPQTDTLPHFHPVQVYYEDTDHSGVVYHANYLKFFERAREHLLGVDELLRLANAGTWFVVYRADVTYREPAVFGQQLRVRTSLTFETDYRLLFHQDLLPCDDTRVLVAGKLHLVCVDGNRRLVPLPAEVITRFGLEDH